MGCSFRQSSSRVMLPEYSLQASSWHLTSFPSFMAFSWCLLRLAHQHRAEPDMDTALWKRPRLRGDRRW